VKQEPRRVTAGIPALQVGEKSSLLQRTLRACSSSYRGLAPAGGRRPRTATRATRVSDAIGTANGSQAILMFRLARHMSNGTNFPNLVSLSYQR
jgi:hypothetical protein